MPAQSLLKSTNLHEYSSAQTSRWPCAVTHIKDGHRSDVCWKQTVWLGTCWSYNTFITSRWCLATRKCIEHIGLLLHLLTDQQCHSWYLTNPCSVCSCFAFPKTPTNSHFHTFPQHFNCFSSTLVHSSRDFPAHTQKIQFMQSSELHLISYNDFQGKGGSKRDAVSEGMFHLQISVSSYHQTTLLVADAEESFLSNLTHISHLLLLPSVLFNLFSTHWLTIRGTSKHTTHSESQCSHPFAFCFGNASQRNCFSSMCLLISSWKWRFVSKIK